MAYGKIYYDEIWEVTSKSALKCGEWNAALGEINKKIAIFEKETPMTGSASDGIKNYLQQIHGIIIPIIGSILQTYIARAGSYYGGYEQFVDSGDGSKAGLRYTTIVYDEVGDYGSIKKEIDMIKKMADEVTRNANSVKNNISGLVKIYASPKLDNLNTQLSNAANKAKNVSDKAIAFESRRVNDFNEIDRLITQVQSIINRQLGASRIPVLKYKSGDIASMCDLKSIGMDLKAAADIVQEFEESDGYERAMELVIKRDEMIQQEEESKREWVQWVAVGVAVVGAVTLTVVTAGAASPLACAAVGVGVGMVTTATGHFADNYVKNGSFTEGMDWSKFGKDVLIGGVVGGISAGLGAVSTGSAIKQPIEKALWSFSKTAAEKGAKGLINVGWDVGEAIITKKPGDEIISILHNDTKDLLKEITIEAGKDFVGDYITGKFDINTSHKGYFKRTGEDFVKNIASTVTKEGLSLAWDMGECVFDPNSSKNVQSVLQERGKEFASDFIKSMTKDLISEGFPGINNMNNSAAKVISQALKDTVGDTARFVAGGVTERGMDYLYGNEKDSSKILGDIWEGDLDGGRQVVKSFGERIGNRATDEALKNEKLYVKLHKIDYDKDGKVDFVQFDDYAVTKEDYDAAVANAGKGAFKDKTVQDILGLPKDTDINSGKVRSVPIDMTEKYQTKRKTVDTVTIGGKYTFKKDFYESAVNAAGKGEYSDKTVQDILGISNDVDISEENISHKRYDKDIVGPYKKVKLTNDDSTDATKIHISSMKHETKIEREKNKNNQ